MSRSALWRAAWACCAVASVSAADAQVITVKTSRIALGDIEGFLPASRGGMGNLLAVTDTLAEPFDNPAAGARLRGTQVIIAPSFYDITRNSGGGSSLPVMFLRQVGPSFGGAVLAVQELKGPRNEQNFNIPQTQRSSGSGGGFASRLAPNRYAYAMLGHSFEAASVAASVKWSGLDAVDGVELLYPGATELRRTSNALDVRLGALREKPAVTVEAALLYTRSGATHDITTPDLVFNPSAQFSTQGFWIDHDRDRVRRFGAHVAVSRPVDSLWRVAAVLTANRIVHADPPALGAMSIARDPARATAINAGIGLARVGARSRIGFDAIYEPISARGSITGAENDDRYDFRNSILRGGVSRDFEPDPGSKIRVEFGAQVHSIRFTLDRAGAETRRGWNDWTHTWGISLLDQPFSMHLRGRIQSGGLRPANASDVFAGGCDTCAQDIAPGGGWPGSVPQLMGVRVATTQLSISVPVR